jgi:signal transduction histidine kinase
MRRFAHPQDDRVAFPLRDVVATAATVSRNEWKYVAELRNDIDEDITVFGVRSELGQVFLNLIINAAHAIGERYAGRGKGSIVVSARKDPSTNMIAVRVRDDGCGIKEANRRRIFDAFFTTKDVGRGTGQGLTITWSIVVEKHGGTIDVDSKEGEGTTFFVSLPCPSVAARALVASAQPVI